MKRFIIMANGQQTQEDLTGVMQQVVRAFQQDSISPIEVLDNEKKTRTIYRKGTHDRNYFVRTKDIVQPYPQGDCGITTIGNTGGSPDQVYNVQKVAKPKKSRTVKPRTDETQ